jgi:hypothetical protein
VHVHDSAGAAVAIALGAKFWRSADVATMLDSLIADRWAASPGTCPTTCTSPRSTSKTAQRHQLHDQLNADLFRKSGVPAAHARTIY